jgi:hypothetical protein
MSKVMLNKWIILIEVIKPHRFTLIAAGAEQVDYRDRGD